MVSIDKVNKVCYNNIMETITQYWSIIVCIVGVIITFANLKSQNGEQERRIVELEHKVEGMNPLLTEIKERLASIETTLKILTK